MPEDDEESDKTVQFTSNKLNVKVKAEIKLLKQSIKAKDDEIKNLKKSPTGLENKLKAETKKACELKQSRDHYKKISNDLQARDKDNPEQIKHLEKEIESKQIIIKFLMSALSLPKDSEIDQPLSNYSVVDSPFSTTAPTKELSNKTSVLNVRDQGEQRDASDLKSMQGTSEDDEQINELPTKHAKVETESSKCMWYEAKNNNGDIYYWNEKTMIVSKKKPKGNVLYLQDNKKNTKTAQENIDVGGDLKKTRFCKFYKQGRCKFGENCRNLHEKETPPRFNKKKSSGDKRGKYNNPCTVQSTENEPSLMENPVRSILSVKESPQIQDLFTVTKTCNKTLPRSVLEKN